MTGSPYPSIARKGTRMLKLSARVAAAAFTLALLAGCGGQSSGSADQRSGETSGNGAEQTRGKGKAESEPRMVVGSADQLLKAQSPLTGYVSSESLEFENHLTDVALDGDRIWAAAGSNVLYEISMVMDGRNISSLTVDREIDLGCAFNLVTPHADKVWFAQPRCDDGEVTFAAVNKNTGEVSDRHVITARNSYPKQPTVMGEYIYLLIQPAFGIVRLPLASPGDFQTLDLRPDSEGKSGSGDMGAFGDRLWVMDRGRNQAIEVDTVGFGVISTAPFAEIGVTDEILSCTGGSAGIYCRSEEAVIRFDPALRRVAARWAADGRILSITTHGNSVFVGQRLVTTELDARDLKEIGSISGIYADNLQVGPLR